MARIFTLSSCALCAWLFVALLSCRKSSNPGVLPPPTDPDPDTMVETAPPELRAVSLQVNDAFGGYYIGLPARYSETRKDYPLLVFLHGAGQVGNGTTDLHYITNDGIGKLLKKQTFPPNFTVDGKNFSFIVVSPQFSRAPTSNEVAEFMKYLNETYRVDDKRLYLSGLSLGGRITTSVAAYYAKDLAAVVPIAGVALHEGMEDRCAKIAAANLPLWELHNADDPLADVADVQRFISLIQGFGPEVQPRITVFNAYGHDAWTTALDPSYRENGMNIYEWMLQHSR